MNVSTPLFSSSTTNIDDFVDIDTIKAKADTSNVTIEYMGESCASFGREYQVNVASPLFTSIMD